jgi:hypothetical protein
MTGPVIFKDITEFWASEVAPCQWNIGEGMNHEALGLQSPTTTTTGRTEIQVASFGETRLSPLNYDGTDVAETGIQSVDP